MLPMYDSQGTGTGTQAEVNVQTERMGKYKQFKGRSKQRGKYDEEEKNLKNLKNLKFQQIDSKSVYGSDLVQFAVNQTNDLLEVEDTLFETNYLFLCANKGANCDLFPHVVRNGEGKVVFYGQHTRNWSAYSCFFECSPINFGYRLYNDEFREILSAKGRQVCYDGGVLELKCGSYALGTIYQVSAEDNQGCEYILREPEVQKDEGSSSGSGPGPGNESGRASLKLRESSKDDKYYDVIKDRSEEKKRMRQSRERSVTSCLIQGQSQGQGDVFEDSNIYLQNETQSKNEVKVGEIRKNWPQSRSPIQDKANNIIYGMSFDWDLPTHEKYLIFGGSLLLFFQKYQEWNNRRRCVWTFIGHSIVLLTFLSVASIFVIYYKNK